MRTSLSLGFSPRSGGAGSTLVLVLLGGFLLVPAPAKGQGFSSVHESSQSVGASSPEQSLWSGAPLALGQRTVDGSLWTSGARAHSHHQFRSEHAHRFGSRHDAYRFGSHSPFQWRGYPGGWWYPGPYYIPWYTSPKAFGFWYPSPWYRPYARTWWTAPGFHISVTLGWAPRPLWWGYGTVWYRSVRYQPVWYRAPAPSVRVVRSPVRTGPVLTGRTAVPRSPSSVSRYKESPEAPASARRAVPRTESSRAESSRDGASASAQERAATRRTPQAGAGSRGTPATARTPAPATTRSPPSGGRQAVPRRGSSAPDRSVEARESAVERGSPPARRPASVGRPDPAARRGQVPSVRQDQEPSVNRERLRGSEARERSLDRRGASERGSSRTVPETRQRPPTGTRQGPPVTVPGSNPASDSRLRGPAVERRGNVEKERAVRDRSGGGEARSGSQPQGRELRPAPRAPEVSRPTPRTPEARPSSPSRTGPERRPRPRNRRPSGG